MIKNALFKIFKDSPAVSIESIAESISDALDYAMNGGDHPTWYSDTDTSEIFTRETKKALYELIVVRLDKPVSQATPDLAGLIVPTKPTKLWIYKPTKFIETIKEIRAIAGYSLKEAKDIVDGAKDEWVYVCEFQDLDLFQKAAKRLAACGAVVDTKAHGAPAFPDVPF